MRIVVQKYGGSSLADVSRLRDVAELVVAKQAEGFGLVVVVSAMANTTDELIALAASVSSSPPQRELDMLVTAGERISMALLSMAIAKLGGDAISFTGSQSGIITEANHQGAQIIEVTPWRVREALEDGKIVIVAGYQGVSREREITTLGRGGSDTTAVAMAAALGAEVCEIFSDVDGVYDADPRVCPQAALIPRLDYLTMQAIAGAGARVLNAQAVEFARRAEIIIHAGQTGDRSGRVTKIGPPVPTKRPDTEPQPGIAAVVGTRHISEITFSGDRKHVQEQQQAVIDELTVLGARLLSVDVVVATSDSDLVNDRLFFHREDVAERSAAPINAIVAQAGGESRDVGLVTVVGSGLLPDVWHLARRVALANMVDGDHAAATSTTLSFSCSPAQTDELTQTLHAALLGAKQ